MSSESDSDEDYVPGVPEQLSEEESADEETEQQYETEQEQKASKRKPEANTKGPGKKKKKVENSEDVEQKKDETEIRLKPVEAEEEKKHEEDLWAMFLEGTDTKPKAKETPNGNAKHDNKPTTTGTTSAVTQKKREDAESVEKRIFEFAGETIVVENNVIKEKTASTPVIKESKPPAPSLAKPKGGLSNVLSQLTKSNKLSTLEKSKLDWQTYKKVEGIEEEVKAINKGKEGYLERRDFLERTDMRQYEIERDLRMKRRSNR